ncbi:MAG: phosphotransferase [Verrucomicrobia bacterium]|nr:phosphotransferase [Verrucomicrobiota bacterium]
MAAISALATSHFTQPILRETQSLLSIISLEEETAASVISKIRQLFKIQGELSFQKLPGGDCNFPILILQNPVTPLAVLKQEKNTQATHNRLYALGAIRASGFDALPLIYDLGDLPFSCIEYLEPDPNPSHSLESMFQLAAKFHAHTKNSPWTEALLGKTIYLYIDYPFETPPTAWEPELFQTEQWKLCIQYVHYFASPEFLEIYEKLPMQIIHGDLTPNNTIICQGKTYLVDLDKVRTDVRLIDFAALCGWSFLDRYLELTESGKLQSFIETHYGVLEEIEYRHFHKIVMLFRCGVLKWSLKELLNGLSSSDTQKIEQFGKMLKGTIQEINAIHKYAPIEFNSHF